MAQLLKKDLSAKRRFANAFRNLLNWYGTETDVDRFEERWLEMCKIAHAVTPCPWGLPDEIRTRRKKSTSTTRTRARVSSSSPSSTRTRRGRWSSREQERAKEVGGVPRLEMVTRDVPPPQTMGAVFVLQNFTAQIFSTQRSESMHASLKQWLSSTFTLSASRSRRSSRQRIHRRGQVRAGSRAPLQVRRRARDYRGDAQDTHHQGLRDSARPRRELRAVRRHSVALQGGHLDARRGGRRGRGRGTVRRRHLGELPVPGSREHWVAVCPSAGGAGPHQRADHPRRTHRRAVWRRQSDAERDLTSELGMAERGLAKGKTGKQLEAAAERMSNAQVFRARCSPP